MANEGREDARKPWERNPAAVASLAVGVLSVIAAAPSAWGGLAAIPGVILGLIGVRRAKRGAGHFRLAVAGLALSAAVILFVLGFVYDELAND